MKYEILDMITFNKCAEELINRCYQMWKEVYGPILAEAKEVLIPEDFYRAKLISLLHEDGEILAFALHNNLMLSLEGVSEVAYLSPLPEEIRNKLKEQRKTIMTVEWVTANPKIRGRFTKIQPGEVIVGLATRLMTVSPWASIMGFSRTDLKANKIGAKFGVRGLGMIKRHNIECEIMFADQDEITVHPFSKIEKVISECWTNRVDHSTYFNKMADFPNEKKVA